MKNFRFKQVNFVMRVLQTDNDKFKFDVLYKTDLVITNNKEYDNIKDCINGLANYCDELSNISVQDHLIVDLSKQ